MSSHDEGQAPEPGRALRGAAAARCRGDARSPPGSASPTRKKACRRAPGGGRALAHSAQVQAGGLQRGHGAVQVGAEGHHVVESRRRRWGEPPQDRPSPAALARRRPVGRPSSSVEPRPCSAQPVIRGPASAPPSDDPHRAHRHTAVVDAGSPPRARRAGSRGHRRAAAVAGCAEGHGHLLRSARCSIMPGVGHEVSVRAPLRIALGGGGTDLPSHYREHGGFVVSAAIDRRVQRARRGRPTARVIAWSTSSVEEVDDPAEIRHPILRAAIARHWNGRPLTSESTGDVPPGHRARLVGHLHGVRRQGAGAGRGPRPVARRAGRGRVRHRARRPRAHRRQAGPVRGGLRGRERVHVRARRLGRTCAGWTWRRTRAPRSPSASCSSSPARAARPRRCWPARCSARWRATSSCAPTSSAPRSWRAAVAEVLEEGRLERARAA